MTTIAVAETAESTALHGFWTRSRKAGIALIVVGLALAIGIGALAITAGDTASFQLDKTGGILGWDGSWTAPAQTLVQVLGGLTVLCGLVLITGKEQRFFGLLAGAGVTTTVLALLTWAIAGSEGVLKVEYVLAGAMFSALPLIFGSLSGVLCERSGVINVGIEGQLLAGAFCGALFGTLADSVLVGVATSAIAGCLVTLLLATLTVRFQVDQVVLGVILNLLVLGLTGYLYDKLMKSSAETFNDPPDAPVWTIPGLADIPILGPMLFRQSMFVYVALVLVVVIWLMLFKTRWGLRTRAVGEHPQAADTVGIKVNPLRFRNVVIAGLISGFGGALFTIGEGLGFAKDMTVGKGFIALAVLIVGRWHPLGALAGALLFGFADQIAQFLGLIGSPVPTSFLSMLPYLVTIVAVAGLIGRVRAPAADGKPYIKS